MQQDLKPSVVSSPMVETDFAQLEDGSLVEMIEDPQNPSRAQFVLYKDADARIVDRVHSPAGVLKPLHREAEVVKHVRLPKGVKDYGSVAALLWRMNEEIFTRCLDLDNDKRFLLACFVVSTWFIDCAGMPVAPYLALVGPPSSGKSTVLRILRLLCRRSLLTADISSAAFYQVCERLTPTLLIDEAATTANSRYLLHLLRIGTSREVVTLRKGQSFKAYGAKAVAWNELPNDSALNSRCIILSMCETTRRDLKSPNDAEIVATADDIQQQLLQYRIAKFNKLRAREIVDDKEPRVLARYWDLYNALGLAIAEDERYSRWLWRCIKSQMLANREPLPAQQAAVLQTLYRLIHLEEQEGGGQLMADLTRLVNIDLKKSRESFRLTPRGVGAALSSFGISNRSRTNLGWFVLLNRDARKRIHDLVIKHGLDNDLLLPPQPKRLRCDLCSGELRMFSVCIENFTRYVADYEP